MDLKELGCWSIDWIHVAQDRKWWQMPVNNVMNP